MFSSHFPGLVTLAVSITLSLSLLLYMHTCQSVNEIESRFLIVCGAYGQIAAFACAQKIVEITRETVRGEGGIG